MDPDNEALFQRTFMLYSHKLNSKFMQALNAKTIVFIMK